MYPHKLLSQHFWTAEQRQEFSEKKASIRRDHYRSVAALIKEGGTEEQRQSLSSLSREVLEQGGNRFGRDLGPSGGHLTVDPIVLGSNPTCCYRLSVCVFIPPPLGNQGLGVIEKKTTFILLK